MITDYIQGEKFIELAKFKFAPPRGPNNDSTRNLINNLPSSDYRYLINTLDLRQLQDNDLIYTSTFYVDQLFEKIAGLNVKVRVITHNADTNIDFLPPDNVTKWYAQNVNIKDNRIVSIPIGLENSRWYPEKKMKMMGIIKRPKRYKNMIYINHNVSTNPAKRAALYDMFEGVPYATVERGMNGQSIDHYLQMIYNHPFVICPEGNGIDTHRTWECLYMNTIPIEKRNINNQFYTDLPILFVDDWSEITEKFLYDSYMMMAEKKWNIEKLKFEYWKRLILGN